MSDAVKGEEIEEDAHNLPFFGRRDKPIEGGIKCDQPHLPEGITTAILVAKWFNADNEVCKNCLKCLCRKMPMQKGIARRIVRPSYLYHTCLQFACLFRNECKEARQRRTAPAVLKGKSGCGVVVPTIAG